MERWKSFTRSKVAVVTAEGRDPRLVIDATASGLNPNAYFPERADCPTMSGIMRMVAGYYAHGNVAGVEPLAAFTLDVKSAHKRIKLREKELGDQFIEANGQLYYYKTCHFGGAWSAYWWARTASALMRIVHRIAALLAGVFTIFCGRIGRKYVMHGLPFPFEPEAMKDCRAPLQRGVCR